MSARGATLDQRRAKHAWDAVQKAKGGSAKEFEKFVGHAKKLPVRIMTSGLGQAVAFKKGEAPGLLDALNGWLAERRLSAQRQDDLLQAVIEGDADFLRRATEEVLAYLQWLKRFADAEGPTDEAGDNG